MIDSRSSLLRFGHPAVLIGIGVLFLATVVDPDFSWKTRSLSSVGEANGLDLLALGSLDQVAFLLFNGALLVGGLLGLFFVFGLGSVLDDPTATAGTVLGVLTLVGMIGVGIAYLDGPFGGFHFLFATLLFFGLTFTMWTFGTAFVRTGDASFGIASIWLSNAQVVVWILWIILETMVFTDDGDTWTYFAVPEFAAALSFGVWVVATARRYGD